MADIQNLLGSSLLGDTSDSDDTLRAKGIYYICGEIAEGSLVDIHQDILLKHLDPKWTEDISIFINSVGGDCGEAWSLIDLLDCIRLDVRTYGMGHNASMAAILVAAGTRGKRFIFRNAHTMIHQFSTEVAGNFNQLTAAAKDLELEQRRHLEFWKTHSVFTTDEEVQTNLLTGMDIHLSPEKAIEFGIADHVVVPVKTDRKDTNKERLGFRQGRKTPSGRRSSR